MSDEHPDRDLLHGLAAVARHLGITPRQARHWHDTGRMPSFQVGKIICARRSSLTAWLAAQEARALHKRRQAEPEAADAA